MITEQAEHKPNDEKTAGVDPMVVFSSCPFCGAPARRFSGVWIRHDDDTEKECGTVDNLNSWLRSYECMAVAPFDGKKRVFKKIQP